MIALAKTRQPWTPERIKFLQLNYAKMGAAWCAVQLGTSAKNVSVQCRNYGIKGVRGRRPGESRAPVIVQDAPVRSKKKNVVNEDELWREYIGGKRQDMLLRNRILELYATELEKFAWSMSKKLGGNVSAEDLVQAGSFGLMDAAKRFEPGRGWKFWTFAVQRVRGAMLDSLRAMDRVSRLDRGIQRDVLSRADTLRQAMRHEPTDDDILESGIPLANLRRCPKSLISIDAAGPQQSDKFERESTLRDSLMLACAPSTSTRSHKTDEFFREATRVLPMHLQTIIYLYLVCDSNMKQIGKVMSKCESWVSQQMTVAVGILRKELDRDRVCELLAS